MRRRARAPFRCELIEAKKAAREQSRLLAQIAESVDRQRDLPAVLQQLTAQASAAERPRRHARRRCGCAAVVSRARQPRSTQTQWL
jgi:hypothetical protein